jgi:hypothetical protein
MIECDNTLLKLEWGHLVLWEDVSYLNRGTDRQRDAYQTLIYLDVFSVLADFDPILAGTFALGIDTEQSDLDILCCAEDLVRFEEIVRVAYGMYDDFAVSYGEKNVLPTVCCRFMFQRFPVGICAQPRPTAEQTAYRHMVAEARLLRIGGRDAEMAIRQLREAGVPTEPAFGEYFNLEGDPYDVLLELADTPTEELVEVVQRANWYRHMSPHRAFEDAFNQLSEN